MKNKYADKIIELRSQGKSYKQIAKILGCSTGTVTYHCTPGQKEKAKNRVKKLRSKQHPYFHKYVHFIESKPIKTNRSKSNYSIYRIIYLKIRTFSRKENNMCEPEFTVEDVINKFGENPVCYLTGEPIDIYKPKTYQFDHIIPRSRGGSNSLDNLGITTIKANQCKRDLMYNEFIALCKSVIDHYNKVTRDGSAPTSLS